MNRIIEYFTSKYLAAWVVLLSDTALVFVSFVVATILRYNFELAQIEFSTMMLHSGVTTVVYFIVFLVRKTSAAVLRHSGLNDLIKVFRSGFIASAILVAFASVLLYIFEYRGDWLIPKSSLIIQYLLVGFLLSLSRLIAKATYAAFLRNNSELKSNTLIYGAGESGRITCQTLLSESTSTRKLRNVIGFVDHNPSLHGKSLEGRPVFPPERALTSDFLLRNKVDQVILADSSLGRSEKVDITDFLLDQNIEIKEIPPYDHWIHGELSFRQIQPVKIENLLGRSEIKLDSNNISKALRGKTILVTGGAGSIGSEIVRQSLHFDPRKVIVLDQAESAVFDLEVELRNEFASKERFAMLIGDVKNKDRMRVVFERYRPDIVFHAAAYKHVPMMELNPFEAAQTNIFGSKVIADLSIEFKIEKFVLISTDKAINPTNVMGTTKRIAEIYVQSLNESNKATKFITTRFGNVLGSNGSVIPLFKKQIDAGGPVTVTHKDITRFFMTISEACNLVLEAGAMGKDGEIFVFDMGRPIKIYDMARKMVRLSGLQEGQDIDIEITGLRPGEKLFEEVLASEENTIPTHHEKILKAKKRPITFEELDHNLAQCNQASIDNDLGKLITGLKNLVPEFSSVNPTFKAAMSPNTVTEV